MSDAPPLPPLPKPRLWTALTVTLLGVVASVVIATIVLLIAMYRGRRVSAGAGARSHGRDAAHPGAALGLGGARAAGPGHHVQRGVRGGAAFAERLAKRLGYTRSLLPWRAFPLLLAGTFFAGGLGGIIVERLFQDPGPGMRMIQDMMQKPTGAGLAILAILIWCAAAFRGGVFRGYLQRRLLQRWHPAAPSR